MPPVAVFLPELAAVLADSVPHVAAMAVAVLFLALGTDFSNARNGNF